MNLHVSPKRSRSLISSIMFLTLLLVSYIGFNSAYSAEIYAATITASTDKPEYYIREPITVQGTFTIDGQPATDSLIAMEIRDAGGEYFAFRTVKTGNPQEAYFTLNLTLMDKYNNPITLAKVRDELKLKISVTNNLLNEMNITVAYTLYDNTLIPMWSKYWKLPIYGNTTLAMWDTYVPIAEWAKPGKAMISANVYSDLPKNGGIAYTPEKLTYFDIVVNRMLPPPYSPMPPSYETQAGQYKIFLRASPDKFAPPGTYTTYISGEVNGTIRPTANTTYNVISYPTAPLPGFTYYPPTLYENMTATFEASSSSAEGYHDDLTKLTWKINDPYNPETIVRNPPNWNVTHKFSNTGSFTVELNVTDLEGLWATTSKLVVVNPQFGPTANFTWTPSSPYPRSPTTFNASLSTVGWSKQAGNFSPIVQYVWNFGDETGNTTTSSPTTTHLFPEMGNFTVTLIVFDAVGRTDSKSKAIQVLNYTSFPWDVTGDGYVGIDDIFEVAVHYGLTPADPGWNPNCDINKDDYIGIDDIFEVAMHFGEEWP